MIPVLFFSELALVKQFICNLLTLIKATLLTFGGNYLVISYYFQSVNKTRLIHVQCRQENDFLEFDFLYNYLNGCTNSKYL